jgi:hypothetical protein
MAAPAGHIDGGHAQISVHQPLQPVRLDTAAICWPAVGDGIDDVLAVCDIYCGSRGEAEGCANRARCTSTWVKSCAVMP